MSAILHALARADALRIVIAALAIDLAFGEPPDALHPVAWMGHVIAFAERLCPSRGARRQLVAGALVALVVPSLFAGAAWLALRALRPWPWAETVAAIAILKSTFAVRALRDAARVVRDAVIRGDVDEARRSLRALCSRDAARLDPPALVAATIESVAENASDSVVAPLFWFALFGVPGAVFYRAVNTLDAMIGYRGKYEWLGKASARLDDLLNLAPARITALLLLVAGWALRRDARAAVRVLARDGARTESPNAGRPMAVMAGLLRVELAKDGCYRLGDGVEALAPAKIDEAWRVVAAGAFAAAAVAIGAAEVVRAIGR